MSEGDAPKVDGRSAQDVARQVRKLLAAYAPPWSEAAGGGALGDALIGIFSRFSEIVIQRLNRTPEKNLLAYLDLLGLSVLPPQPARVPLTFYLAEGSLTDAIVPAGTQVASKQAPGEAEPVTYETERELTVVAARLSAAYTLDPPHDSFTEQGTVIGALSVSSADLFVGAAPLEHAFYVGHENFLDHPALKKLRLSFALKQGIAVPRPRQAVWELWDGEGWDEIAPKPTQGGGAASPTGFVEDLTDNLTRGGDVVFTHLPVVRPSEVGGRTGRWLRCRLKTPIPPADFGPAAHPAQLPTVQSVTLSATLERRADDADTAMRPLIEAAFVNYAPADTSKSFFAFGERPRAGDALYLAQSEAFAAAGALVTLDISLTRPAVNPATRQPYPEPSAVLAWEFWDGRTWSTLFTTSNGVVAPQSQNFSDTTNALTQPGRVTFRLPRQPARTVVGGVESYWVRARIVVGDYGKDAYYTLKENSTTEYVLVPATYAPPTVDSLGVGYTVTLAEPPDRLVTYNDFTYKTVESGSTFEPFKTTADTPASFYVGLTLPEGRRSFPNRVVSLYVSMQPYLYGLKPDVAAPASPPRLNWQYWNGGAWTKMTVIDGTADLTRDGLLEFLVPADFALRREFGVECYWVRVLWEAGQYQFRPRVRALLLNTTTAAQTLTVRDENLGSSDASAGQKFKTTAAPVLPGQSLLVREPDRPSAEEWARIDGEEGADAVTLSLDEMERLAEIWVRWHEVPDFYGSNARDRHYVVNHLTGEIIFGDGLNGMIPPRGAGNLRLSFYQTGGGRAGNRAAGTITELKTTVPYVDSVVNVLPAEGGADAEGHDSLVHRGPRSIRHRDRAVTTQDYEDLALLSTAGVARVKCVPLQDMAVGIDLKQPKEGVLSLIIVPDSTDARPYPDLELLDTVRSYLDRRRAADARLVVVGPEYVRVAVRAQVVPESAEVVGRLDGEITAALARFLHPLTGGSEGTGWNFGRKPHTSDLYSIIESVAGVAYVRRLRIDGWTDVRGVETPVEFDRLPEGQRYFLVYSGEHEIELVFD